MSRVFMSVLVLFISLVLYGCQYIGEFPAPRGGVQIKDMPETQGKQVYAHIIKKLADLGFVEKPIRECVSLFRDTADCPQNFKLTESGQAYEISLQIQLDSSGESIVYQYAEYYLQDIANRDPFTSTACKVLNALNGYVMSVAPTDSVAYPGGSRCDAPTVQAQ